MAQPRHSDLKHRKNKSSDFFAILTHLEGVNSYWFPCFQKLMFYLETGKITLAKKPVLKDIMAPPDSFFIGHGYFQHSRAELRTRHCLRYHI